MKDTDVKVENEVNTTLSKLSEEQFNELRQMMDFIQQLSSVNLFDGFYPTLNTELLTRIREVFNLMKRVKSFKNDLTEDEFISIVKDYGRSYCQMWCMAYSSGNLFLIGNLFNSIDEFNAGYNIS